MNVSPLLARPGAVVVEGGSVAAHYGDPLARAAAAGRGRRAGRPQRPRRRRRPRRRPADLAAQPDQPAPGAAGRRAAAARRWCCRRTGTSSTTSCSPTSAAPPGPTSSRAPGTALVDFLQKMRFMLRVDPALVTDAWAVLSLVGPNGPEILTAAGLPVPAAPYAVRALDARLRPPDARRSATARRPCSTSSSRAAEIEAVADRLGAPLAGFAAYEALRVEARRPRFGVDSDHRTIPNELPVAADRRPPGQGLLPRPGDGGPGAQPGPAAAPAGPAAPGRRQRGAGRAGDAGARRHPRGRPGRHRWCATTSSGVIALALVKQSVAMDAALTVAGSTASIDPDDAPADARRHPGGGPRAGARGPVCDDRPVTLQHSHHRRAHRGGVGEGRRPGAAGDRRGGRRRPRGTASGSAPR